MTDEIRDGACHEHLAGLRLRRHSCAEVHGEATELLADGFAFARVQPVAHFQTEIKNGSPDRRRIADRAIGPSNAAKKPSPNVQLWLLEVARGVARDAISCRASELLAFQPIPFRQAAYGFVDIRAGLFDLLHVEPS